MDYEGIPPFPTQGPSEINTHETPETAVELEYPVEQDDNEEEMIDNVLEIEIHVETRFGPNRPAVDMEGNKRRI